MGRQRSHSLVAPWQRCPTVSYCPAPQRPLPTAGEDGAHPWRSPSSRVPRPWSVLRRNSVAGIVPCITPGRRAPGHQARGPAGVECPLYPTLRARLPGRASRPPTWWRRAVRRRGRFCARGSHSRPGLLAAAATAVTTGRSREQRFPPQRSAASDRPYTERELSPTPLPASVAPSPPPPSVAGSPAGAQQRPRQGPRRVRLGGSRRGGCPNGGVPRESQSALPCGPDRSGQEALEWPGNGSGRAGNPGLGMEIPNQGLSFFICKKGGRVG